MTNKPKVKLTGTDGNVFSLMGKCGGALRKAGMIKEADQMYAEITKSGSYSEALGIMSKYLDVS